MSGWWFAPRATARFTAVWWQRRPSGLRVYGELGFWICVFYLWIAYKIIQAALWLVIVVLIWAAQLAAAVVALPAAAVSAARRPAEAGQP